MERLAGSKVCLTICETCGETSPSEVCIICKSARERRPYIQAQGLRVRTLKSLAYYGERSQTLPRY